MKRIKTLLLGDIKNIYRDTLLVALPFSPLLIGCVLRFLIPFITLFLKSKFGFDLLPYYDLIMGFMIMVTPMLYGFVIGFLLLDDRDEGLFNSISVTPIGKTGYLTYKLTLPVVTSFIFTYLMIIIGGIIKIDYFYLLPVALMSSLEAPLWALTIAAFSSNKIEGLAFAKGLGVLFVAPIAGYFVTSPLGLFFGIIPPYWIIKSFISIGKDLESYLFYAICGIVSHIVYLFILVKFFNKKIEG